MVLPVQTCKKPVKPFNNVQLVSSSLSVTVSVPGDAIATDFQSTPLALNSRSAIPVSAEGFYFFKCCIFYSRAAILILGKLAYFSKKEKDSRKLYRMIIQFIQLHTDKAFNS